MFKGNAFKCRGPIGFVKRVYLMALLVFIAGCVQKPAIDAEEQIKSLSQFQQFVSQNPGSLVKADFWPSGSIGEEEKEECGKLGGGEYWRGEAIGSKTKLIIWTDNNLRKLCSIEEELASSEEPATTTTTTTVPVGPTATGFDKAVPENWELTDDGTLTITIANKGKADIKVLKLKVDGADRAVTQSLVGAGGKVEFTANGVKPGLAGGSRFTVALSIVYELKSLPGEQIESSGTVTGFVKGVQEGKLLEIASVNCYNGKVIVSNVGTQTIKSGEIKASANGLSIPSNQDLSPTAAVTLNLNVNLQGKLVTVTGPANTDTKQC